MGNHAARLSRRQPSFDALEVRSLLSGNPFGTGPVANVASGTVTAFRVALLPGSISTGPGALAPHAEVEYAPNLFVAPPEGFRAFVTSQWLSHVSPVPGPEAIPRAVGPGIQPVELARFDVTAPSGANSWAFTWPAALDPPADADPALVDAYIVFRFDAGPEMGYAAAPPNFVSLSLNGPPRGKVQTMEPDAAGSVDPVGLENLSATGTAAVLVIGGKGAETALGVIASTVTAVTAAGVLPVQPASPVPSVSLMGALPASEAVAALPAERGTGAPAAAAARIGAGRATSPGAGLISASGASISVDVGGNEADGLPRPIGADLIGELLPFQRTPLDRILNRFLEQFNDVDVQEFVEHNPIHVVFFSLTLSSAAVALDQVRRRWRQRSLLAADVRVRDPLASRDLFGFPELPGSWSSRLT
jgi:hypothetical protein